MYIKCICLLKFSINIKPLPYLHGSHLQSSTTTTFALHVTAYVCLKYFMNTSPLNLINFNILSKAEKYAVTGFEAFHITTLLQ